MTIGPAVQKLLALALLAGLAFVLWVGVAVPVVDGYERDRAAAAQSVTLIERYRAVLAGLPALEAEIGGLKTHAVLKKGLFVAPSSEIAAATLQGMIKASAAAAEAKLISVQVLAPKEEAGFNRIGVRARLSGTVAALRSVLYELQTAWPALVVDAVNVRARTRRQRTEKGARATLVATPDLAINFDVYGFMAQPAAKAAGGKGGDK